TDHTCESLIPRAGGARGTRDRRKCREHGALCAQESTTSSVAHECVGPDVEVLIDFGKASARTPPLVGPCSTGISSECDAVHLDNWSGRSSVESQIIGDTSDIRPFGESPQSQN